jgi:trans-2,3-dihydro-3-hydroxyanthranilate isomerase
VFVSLTGHPLCEPQASLRFFTNEGELPACGHATVAALAFLATSARHPEYRANLVASGRRFTGWATPQAGNMAAEFDPGPVQLRAATVQERDLALDTFGPGAGAEPTDICVASIGRPRLLVPVATASALAWLTPDLERLRRGCDRLGLLGCYVHSIPAATGRLRARMFAPSIGVPEDIANANSTACLAARLAGRGISSIAVEMGDCIGMPATITATTRGGGSPPRIHVGGAAAVGPTIKLDRHRRPE